MGDVAHADRHGGPGGTSWCSPARVGKCLPRAIATWWTTCEALSEPGQWYLDRPLGQLTYISKPGEQPGQAVLIAPRLEQLLVLQGDLTKKRWVRHIQFSGLSFAHTNWTLPPTGQDFPQAEIGLNAAIVAIGARQIVLERCAVRHVGGYGMAFGSGSRNNRVEGCELVDLAGGGVKIGHAGFGTCDQIKRISDDPEMHVSHHVIRNCLIAHGGRLHPGRWESGSDSLRTTRGSTMTSSISTRPEFPSVGPGATALVTPITTTLASITCTLSDSA